MSPKGGRAPSVLCLIVIAAGLNIYSASSTSTSTTSNIVSSVRTELASQTFMLISSITTGTTKAATRPVTLVPRIPLSETSVPSNTPDMIASTNSLSPPSTELQSTEHMSTSVMSVDRSATTNMSTAETLATATSSIMSVSSTISSSSAPERHTSTGVTQLSSIEVSTVPVTSEKHPTEGTTSGDTTNFLTSASPVVKLTSSQGTLASKATVETSPTGSTTFSSGVTMQEVQQALSSGSIAAITITVIAVVILVFGIAAFLKIRHSSYGRLFDDHDYGSWGNYNNPLYDDS
ncbi:prostate androgen-regulated mucin-like protein 1 [Candoia aspera]|uniref:prostate androgen-regulated mucin-like protein 1 n=1 Tax=Candoia aspera TaxID=51853 RepID=UPI002FD8477C